MKKKNKIIAVAGALVMSLLLSSCTIFDLVSKVSSSSVSSDSYSKGDGVVAKTMRDVYPYYMPSTGNIKVLVIPVQFSDYSSYATDAVKSQIETTFFGNAADTGWESVSSFYSASSYGKLNISGTVSDWYKSGYTTSQLSKKTSSLTAYDPTWTILENAVSWYKSSTGSKCTEFDSDSDGLIDAVWLVYGAPYDKNSDLYWAYTYADSSVSTVSTKNPSPYYYSWASYKFMYEGYGQSNLDAHTFIHETGHLMGLDDYYVYSSELASSWKTNYNPMGSIDMMDVNIIDHNSFSKEILGWNSPQVVTKAGEFTINKATLDGSCLLIPTGDGWNGSSFDEYMLLEYYTPDSLNEKDSASAYPGNKKQGFTTSGVRIFHVDARLAGTSDGENYYYSDTAYFTNSKYTTLAHSNTSGRNAINPKYRLIQTMDCQRKVNFDCDSYTKLGSSYAYEAQNSSLFGKGDVFSYSTYSHSFPNSANGTMNDGTKLGYKATIKSLGDTSATIVIENA